MEGIYFMKKMLKRFFNSCFLGLSIFLISGCSSTEKNINENFTEQESFEKTEDTASDRIDGNYLEVFELYDYSGYPSFEEAFKDSQLIEHLKKLNQQLHSKYHYLEISLQSSQVIGHYDGDVRFVLDDDESMLNQVVEIDGKQTYVTTLKTVTLDQKVAGILSKYVENGRSFNSDEYTVVDENIPVILGSEYADIYSIGDTIQANYLSLDVCFKIIGFLEEGTQFSISDQDIVLDYYICLPAFETNLEMNDQNEKFLQIYNLQKNCGFIQIEDNCSEDMVEKYRNDIFQLAEENDLYYDAATLQINLCID